MRNFNNNQIGGINKKKTGLFTGEINTFFIFNRYFD